MVQQVTPKPGVLRIAPYVGGAAPAKGQEGVVKLSSNENPFGPSEAAMTAYRHAGRDLHRYPDTTHAALREAIGEAHGLDPERIVCGAGSDELLHLLAQAFAGQGDEVIHTEHGFAMYPIVAHAAGAKAVSVPELHVVPSASGGTVAFFTDALPGFGLDLAVGSETLAVSDHPRHFDIGLEAWGGLRQNDYLLRYRLPTSGE